MRLIFQMHFFNQNVAFTYSSRWLSWRWRCFNIRYERALTWSPQLHLFYDFECVQVFVFYYFVDFFSFFGSVKPEFAIISISKLIIVLCHLRMILSMPFWEYMLICKIHAIFRWGHSWMLEFTTLVFHISLWHFAHECIEPLVCHST